MVMNDFSYFEGIACKSARDFPDALNCRVEDKHPGSSLFGFLDSKSPRDAHWPGDELRPSRIMCTAASSAACWHALRCTKHNGEIVDGFVARQSNMTRLKKTWFEICLV